MARKLSPWCKNARITMIEKNLSVSDLSKNIGLTREYTSSILNGRVYAAPAVKKISSFLGIPDDDITSENELVRRGFSL